jgi:hypothetical protein
MKDIEIKNIEVKPIAMQTKKTAYMCVFWHSGVPYFSGASEQKDFAERYAHDMLKSSDHVEILKFEIEIPFNQNK